jgi:Tol biopolymer transport system component
MKKMFLLFGLLALAGVLLVACSEQDPTSPDEAAFTKVSNKCTGALLLELQAIDDEIDDVLMHRPSKKGAHQIVDNIARRVCAESPQYDATPSMVEGFYDLLVKQPVDELVGGWSAAAVLLSDVAKFATGDDFDIPEGALAPEGGLGVAVPGVATTILTNNMEAAVVADPNSFDGTEPAIITLVRLPDPEFGTGTFYGLPAFAEAYNISSTREPSAAGDGVVIAECVVDWFGPPPTRAIAHDLGEGFEILVPIDLYSVAEDGVVDCTDAGPYEGGGEVIGAGAGVWYESLAQAIKPAVERFFTVKPLHAMYFAGTGLGGRTKSFSEFVPVDPVIDVDEDLLLTVGTAATWSSNDEDVATVVTTGEGNGLVTGQAPGTAIITADFGGEESLSLEITVLSIGGDLIAFTSNRIEDTEIYVMNTDGSNPVNLTNSAGLDAGPVWSPDGSRIAFQSRRNGNADIWVMNADGSIPTNLTDNDAAFQIRPTWSPDGSQIAFMDRTTFDRIYVMDSDGNNLTPLAGTATDDAGFPAWSPDGTQIAFSTARDGNSEIYVMDADGTNPTRLTNDPAQDLAPVWSPDGSQIAWGSSRSGNSDVWVMDANGANPVNLTNNPASDRRGTWSPDGLQMSFDSDRDGFVEVYTMNADGTGVTRLTFETLDDYSSAWRP